jgi:hypothetical protein
MQGQEVTIAVLVIGLVVIALLAWLFMQRRKTQALREEFGEEYDRTVDARGGTRHAEADLIERKERVAKLDIRPLTTAEHDRYTTDWTATKALFVDSPVEAVAKADRLLTDVMNTRGYPMADFEQRHADLTVEHSEVAKHYLSGHEIADRSSDATTEELRRAINHYEALFSEMTSDFVDRDNDRVHEDSGRDFDTAPEVNGDRVAEAPVRPGADPTLTERDRV